MIVRSLACLLTLLTWVGAATARPETAEEIDTCFRDNFPDDSSVQTISMHARDRMGSVTSSEATLYWKKFKEDRSRVLMRFFEPSDLRGAGLLIIEEKGRNDMFLYLPALGRVKRVTRRMTSASMFGTDFSYEEFERLQGIVDDAESERKDDAEIDGRAAWVLEARPGSDSAYERIRSWIDQETCVVLRAEFYERGDQPRKIMQVKTESIRPAGRIWVAHEILMHDERDRTDTTLRVKDLDLERDVPAKLFSERELVARGR